MDDQQLRWLVDAIAADETGDRFVYSQRLEVGPQVDRLPRDPNGTPSGFDLTLSGADPSDASTFGRPAWTMAGSGGTDRLTATLAPDEAVLAGVPGGLGLDLQLTSTKPPALHDRTMSALPDPEPGSTLLHLGLGSFHRAHQAVYLHHLRESGERTARS